MSPITQHVCSLGQVASVHFPSQIAGVLGWNCYASPEVGGLLVLANQQPLGWDAYFIEPETGFEHDPEGPYPPTENTTGDDICYLRHMETLMPDTGYMALDQGDIHSLMMRRMARSIGTSSVYQHYAFDLINQRQVEIRPSPKTPIDARIFYVKRPRRLIFDNAPIPFFAFPSLGFLRDYALGKLSLSLREFETAKNWYTSAEAERLRLELMMTQMASPRNDTITPGI